MEMFFFSILTNADQYLHGLTVFLLGKLLVNHKHSIDLPCPVNQKLCSSDEVDCIQRDSFADSLLTVTSQAVNVIKHIQLFMMIHRLDTICPV